MKEAPRPQGFQEGGGDGDLFESAAPFYARYRRPYPEPVVAYLVERYGLDGRGRLLDAGCGTGQVFQVTAKYFEETIAIDADKEMLRYAEKTAMKHALDRVKLQPMRGEEINESLGTFRMAIFGASFHWMDRIRVAELVYDRLEPGGQLVVLSPGGIHAGTTGWETEIREILEKRLGPERRAGQGIYRAGERHGEAIRRTRFREVEETEINLLEQWSVDQIVGYLFSTSYASPAVLGNKAEAFEHAVRERLLRLRPDGLFEKVVEYTAICATRPSV
ncbi:class I SAM-dependent methyltransferase [Verrucomicrobiota bacterium sgz303538]